MESEWLESPEDRFWFEVVILAGEVPAEAVAHKIQARYGRHEDRVQLCRRLEFDAVCLEEARIEDETETGETAVDLAKAKALRAVVALVRGGAR